jgi:hypothetical protein
MKRRYKWDVRSFDLTAGTGADGIMEKSKLCMKRTEVGVER